MKWFTGVGYNSAILSNEPRGALGGAGLPVGHPPVPSSSASSSSSASGSTPAATAAARRPPPACPMHAGGEGAKSSAPVPPPAGYAPPKPAGPLTGAAKCPIVHDASSSSSSSSKSASSLSAAASGLNPLNSIPLGLSAVDRAPGQVLDLPVERENSTIPRPRTSDDDEAYGGGSAAGPNGEQVWEYPSPQQFYNALVRKGWETPEESIEVMVAIHNFLNERAWDEVLKWEKRLPGGEYAQLARFQGRPGELSPKARMHLWAGKLLPSKFNTEPPFDRHDWVVTRPVVASGAGDAAAKAATESQQTVTTRYVIDYYSAPPDDHGNPVFHLDVRPALDSFESVSQRIKVGLEEFMKGQQEE